jgi:very-short-patch-repair endonuclease
MTVPEKMLWVEFRKLDLNFRRQCPIGRYIADFACHAARLVVEVDSARHDLSEEQLHDVERSEWLRSQGYKVLRFRNEDVANDRTEVVAAILKAIPPHLLDPEIAMGSPPSPTLPPSRGKGEVL